MKGTPYALSIRAKTNTNRPSLIDDDDDWDENDYCNNDDGLETILGAGHVLF